MIREAADRLRALIAAPGFWLVGSLGALLEEVELDEDE